MGPEKTNKDLHKQIADHLGMDVMFHPPVGDPETYPGPSQGIRRGRRQPFEVEQGDAPRPGVYSVKTHHRPDPKDATGLNTLPIKRAQPKRPEGMSERQWKKARKAARRAFKDEMAEFDVNL